MVGDATPNHRGCSRCGVTLRSSGLPPAGHSGHEPASVIIGLAAQAPRRRQPLSSNVSIMSTAEYVLKLSKFDVAERQLLLAIRLFFSSEDDVSIHTLSEAAGQILHDIGKDAGVSSIVRDSDRIRPERMKEWLAAIFKSRNFFKHADRDKGDVHEFKPEFNDMSLLDAVNMYSTLKRRWTPETLIFLVWFGLKYPTWSKRTAT